MTTKLNEMVKNIPLEDAIRLVCLDSKATHQNNEPMGASQNMVKAITDVLQSRLDAYEHEINRMRAGYQALHAQLVEGKVMTQDMKPVGHWTNIIANNGICQELPVVHHESKSHGN